MSIELVVEGIRFSKVVQDLKDYFAKDGTYMDLIQFLDPNSYDMLVQTFKDPETLLRALMGNALNTMVVTGGKQSGGARQGYQLILILFLLIVSKAYAGPYQDKFSMMKKPIEPSPVSGWFYGNYPVTQATQNTFTAELDDWLSAKRSADSERENESLDAEDRLAKSRADESREDAIRVKEEGLLTREQNAGLQFDYFTSKATKDQMLLEEARNKIREYELRDAKTAGVIQTLLLGGMLGLVYRFVFMNVQIGQPALGYAQPALGYAPPALGRGGTKRRKARRVRRTRR